MDFTADKCKYSRCYYYQVGACRDCVVNLISVLFLRQFSSVFNFSCSCSWSCKVCNSEAWYWYFGFHFDFSERH